MTANSYLKKPERMNVLSQVNPVISICLLRIAWSVSLTTVGDIKASRTGNVLTIQVSFRSIISIRNHNNAQKEITTKITKI